MTILGKIRRRAAQLESTGELQRSGSVGRSRAGVMKLTSVNKPVLYLLEISRRNRILEEYRGEGAAF